MKISQAIPHLFNGISQQPPTMRLLSQAQEQVNGYSSLTTGLTKRPPTEYINDYMLTETNFHCHMINRDPTERYMLLIEDGRLLVLDLSDGEIVANITNSYLDADDPRKDFDTITVADHTYIVNKTKTVSFNSGTAATALNTKQATITLTEIQPGTTYSVYLHDPDGMASQIDATDGTVQTVTTTTPLGSTDTTTYLAYALAAKINAGLLTDYDASVYGNTLIITYSGTGTMFVGFRSSYGNQGYTASSMGKVKDFRELPPTVPIGTSFQISGSEKFPEDDWYVEFDGTVYNEVARGRPGTTLYNGFTSSTMPHRLVRESGGTFALYAIDYNDRTVGDDISAPAPSFVGSTINGVFFFRNRLGFISDENIILSCAGDFYNFWPTTVRQVLDTDPIDTAVSHTKVSILRHALVQGDQLVLWSDQTQFILSADEYLSPTTVKVTNATEFFTDTQAKPVVAGNFIYYTTNRNGKTSLREYYMGSRDDPNREASDVAAHCPDYIFANVYKIISSTNDDLILLLSMDSAKKIMVYKYYWSGNEKVQASWSTWELPSNCRIIGGGLIDSVLYLLIYRTDRSYTRVTLESMKLKPMAEDDDDNAPYLVHLDTKIKISGGTYSSTNDLTVFELPTYDLECVDDLIVDIATGFQLPVVAFTRGTSGANPDTVYVSGDWASSDVYYGSTYLFNYKFSKQYVHTGNEQSQSILEGRLQLKNLLVSYANSGPFVIRVSIDDRDSDLYYYLYEYIGRQLFDTLGLSTGVFKIPVMSEASKVDIAIRAQSAHPLSLQNAEWQGDFHPKTRRI